MRSGHYISSRYLLILLSVAVTSCLKVANRECDEPPPDAITDPASFISSEGAILNGRVTAHGQKTIVTFDLGKTDQYGQTVEPFSSAVSDVQTRTVNIQVSSLFPGTTYHFRLKASGECEDAVGEDISFTTRKTGESGIVFNPDVTYDSVKDIDNHVYKTVKIGTQTWMAENLRTERFRDSTNLPHDLNNFTWTSRTSPAYCTYNNLVHIKFTLGYLYNWYAVQSGKLCPAGWHVPTDSDWSTLISFLGGESAASVKLKMTGTDMWGASNVNATNSSGFTAIPSGFRYGYIDNKGGLFYELGLSAAWWTSTQTSSSTARYRQIDKNGVISGSVTNPGKYLLNNKNFGFAVRCVKN